MKVQEFIQDQFKRRLDAGGEMRTAIRTTTRRFFSSAHRSHG